MQQKKAVWDILAKETFFDGRTEMETKLATKDADGARYLCLFFGAYYHTASRDFALSELLTFYH
jgi:hypothetical protein